MRATERSAVIGAQPLHALISTSNLLRTDDDHLADMGLIRGDKTASTRGSSGARRAG
jgi:hypothetical protein